VRDKPIVEIFFEKVAATIVNIWLCMIDQNASDSEFTVLALVEAIALLIIILVLKKNLA
jgi:hypothetical protein